MWKTLFPSIQEQVPSKPTLDQFSEQKLMPTAATMFFQENLTLFYSRRLLLHSPLFQQSATTATTTTTAPPPGKPYGENTFDANVVMVLSVLLCALICSLGLNSIIRCALRCSSVVGSESATSRQETASARLANTGIKKKALKTFPTVSYWDGLELPGLDKECAICLGEFASGERVKIMPKCNHGFHARCIDKWLRSHSSCPTCRHYLLDTCQKIVAGGACIAASTSSELSQEQGESSAVIVTIMPVQPEGYVRNYET